MSTYDDLDEPRHSTPGVLVSKQNQISSPLRQDGHFANAITRRVANLVDINPGRISHGPNVVLYSVKEPVKGVPFISSTSHICHPSHSQ